MDLQGKTIADTAIQRLETAAFLHMGFSMGLSAAVRGAIVAPGRQIVNINALLRKLEHPMDSSGKEIQIQTRESYKIYNCLKMMPECVKSMEITRGDQAGVPGSNRPLENTICVAVHHVDDKSYGGLCVLREWGAIDMTTIFVGYNPLQSQVWRDMISDIPDEKFTACILESIPSEAGAPVWAEGIYRVARSFNKFPATSMLPSQAFDDIFAGKNPTQKPLPFLDAQRSLCAYNFLVALARGISSKKRVFIWEDGGYLNPIIDTAIYENMSLADFRSKYMLPPDEKTDAIITAVINQDATAKGKYENFAQVLKDWVIGTVELTRNGYDMSAAIAETRELTTNFFSIAASYEKVMLEGDSIVLACIDALSQVLYSTGLSLRNRNVLIMGARGNLGRLSANHLSNLLADSTKQLWCCDVKVDWPSPQPGSVPEWAEWASSDKKIENVVAEVSAYKNLRNSDKYKLEVILGWTGGPKTVSTNGKTVNYKTIDGEDVEDWLTNGRETDRLYLVSGSTKTVEFSEVLTWLEKLINTPEGERQINHIKLDSFQIQAIPDELSIAAVAQAWPNNNPPNSIARNFGTMFTFQFKQDNVTVTKTLYLVNNTMPVNFMFYGTPTEIMDLTYSQVTSCCVAMVKNAGKPGIYPTDYNRKASQNEGVYLAKHLDQDYAVPPSV